MAEVPWAWACNWPVSHQRVPGPGVVQRLQDEEWATQLVCVTSEENLVWNASDPTAVFTTMSLHPKHPKQFEHLTTASRLAFYPPPAWGKAPYPMIEPQTLANDCVDEMLYVFIDGKGGNVLIPSASSGHG